MQFAFPHLYARVNLKVPTLQIFKYNNDKSFIYKKLPTPFRIDFYKELGKLCDLTVVIEAGRSKL